uniref:Uncharacterized protein n=1 Tax=Glossina palpalis gambiensis TaxID=67801 RepID=A0A1B0BSS9_9MUSC
MNRKENKCVEQNPVGKGSTKNTKVVRAVPVEKTYHAFKYTRAVETDSKADRLSRVHISNTPAGNKCTASLSTRFLSQTTARMSNPISCARLRLSCSTLASKFPRVDAHDHIKSRHQASYSEDGDQFVGIRVPFALVDVIAAIELQSSGTVKTTTVVETILQLFVRRPSTHVLVTSSPNSACDTSRL